MSPAWAMQAGATPAPPSPGPPSEGLVFWVKGDTGVTSEAGRATAWADQSGMGQDVNVSIADHEPYVNIDEIDGIPCVSFQLAFGETFYLARTPNMVDRNGDPIGAGPRTVMAMILPKYVAGAFGITGGAVMTFLNQSAPLTCVFDLEDNFTPDGAYAFAPRWRSVSDLSAWGPVTGGAGGPFNNVPTLVEWQLPAFPGITFLVNNEEKTLDPTTRGSDPAVSETGFVLGCGGLGGAETNFFGAFAEVLCWDYDLSTNPAAHAQAVAYMVSRYPSAPIVE